MWTVAAGGEPLWAAPRSLPSTHTGNPFTRASAAGRPHSPWHPTFLAGQPVKLSLLLVIANPFPVEEADFELAENKDPFVSGFWEGRWGNMA